MRAADVKLVAIAAAPSGFAVASAIGPVPYGLRFELIDGDGNTTVGTSLTRDAGAAIRSVAAVQGSDGRWFVVYGRTNFGLDPELVFVEVAQSARPRAVRH